MNVAGGEANRMSHASAISNPALMAHPLMAPTMGNSQRSIWCTTSLSKSSSSVLNTFCAAARSTPALKACVPAPVKTTARTVLSSLKSWNVLASVVSISNVSAFCASGLSIVTTTTPFAVSTLIDIAASSYYIQLRAQSNSNRRNSSS